MRFINVIASVVLLSCTSSPAAPKRAAEKKAAETASRPLQRAGGLGEDARPRVLITRPLSDATSTSGVIEAIVSCPAGGACERDPKRTQELIASKLRLREGGGATIAVTVVAKEPAPQPVPVAGKETATDGTRAQYELKLVAVAPLQPAGTYALEAESDESVVIGFADKSSDEHSASVRDSKRGPTMQEARIATESAPRPIAVELGNAAGKQVAYVRLRFSEPVSLGTLVGGGLAIANDNGQEHAGCIWSGLAGSCASESSSESAEIVDFQLDPPLASASALRKLVLDIPGNVVGRGRTLAEAARARGAALTAKAGREVLRTRLDDGAWRGCGSGQSLCARL